MSSRERKLPARIVEALAAWPALGEAPQLGMVQQSALIEQCPDGVLVLRRNNTVAFANRAALDLLECGLDDLLNRPFPLAAAMERGGEIVLPRRDEQVVVEARSATISWQECPAVLVTLRDVTERYRAEQEAQRAVQVRDRFLGMLSHELRNPLAAILNAAYMVERSDADVESAHDAGRLIQRQARHMARLIDDLLDLSRITQGRVELKQESVSLAQVLEDAVQSTRPAIDAKGHDLLQNISTRPIHVYGDPARLQQVFINLLNNAAKYTPPGGKIAVSLRRDEDEAIVQVRDNGVGIERSHLDRVFNLFVQLESGRENREAGIGVGLTLSRVLVELHGGSIAVASEGSGCGSEFTVRLPLAIMELADPSVSTIISAGVQGERVLLVEDDPDNRLMLQAVLQFDGYQVECAANGVEALEVFNHARPQIVICDLRLPDLSGLEVAQRIRQQVGGDVYLVALTGCATPADRKASLDAGFNAHLAKPLDADKLLQLLAASHLRKAR